MLHRPRFEVTVTGRVSSGSGEATAMVRKRRSAVFWPGSGEDRDRSRADAAASSRRDRCRRRARWRATAARSRARTRRGRRRTCRAGEPEAHVRLVEERELCLRRVDRGARAPDRSCVRQCGVLLQRHVGHRLDRALVPELDVPPVALAGPPVRPADGVLHHRHAPRRPDVAVDPVEDDALVERHRQAVGAVDGEQPVERVNGLERERHRREHGDRDHRGPPGHERLREQERLGGDERGEHEQDVRPPGRGRKLQQLVVQDRDRRVDVELLVDARAVRMRTRSPRRASGRPAPTSAATAANPARRRGRRGRSARRRTGSGPSPARPRSAG